MLSYESTAVSSDCQSLCEVCELSPGRSLGRCPYQNRDQPDTSCQALLLFALWTFSQLGLVCMHGCPFLLCKCPLGPAWKLKCVLVSVWTIYEAVCCSITLLLLFLYLRAWEVFFLNALHKVLWSVSFNWPENQLEFNLFVLIICIDFYHKITN